MIRKFIVAACIGSFLGATFGVASIRLKNRNLFLKFQDLVFQTSGSELVLERVYNSKSPYSGWFGQGWGSTLEVNLRPQADGSVIVQEYGGGAKIRYSPASGSLSSPIETAVRALTDWASSRGTFGSSQQKEAYAKRLRSDADFREQEMLKAIASGKMKVPEIRKGQQFVSEQFQYQFLEKTTSGFTRSLEDGTTQLFDPEGRLLEVRRNNADWKIQYGAHERISEIVDQEGKKLVFQFNAVGLLERIQAPSLSVSYAYGPSRELTGVQTSDGKYEFAYDLGRKHLLTHATYPDKTQIVAKYEDAAHGEDLKYYKERNGMVTEVQSLPDLTDPLHVKFEVSETSADGHSTKTGYEYFIHVKSDGQHWTYRKIETRENSSTETTFNECCGKPLSVVNGRKKTEYTYDPFARLLRVVSEASQESFAYDRTSDHLSRYESQDANGPKYSAIFVYDKPGKLIGVKDSKGSAYLLFYDSTGRLSKFGADKETVEVTFTSQPPGISLESKSGGSVHLPLTGKPPTPQQKPLLSSWDKLIDLMRRSNNPLPN